MTRRKSTGAALIPGVLIVLACAAGAQTSKSISDGVYTEEQAARGSKAYVQHCFECHGRDLRGDVESRPLVGDEFFANWDGTTVLMLFDRIRITMPAVNPGNLSRQQVADILAFVLKANRFPAGGTELSTRAEILKDIRFEIPRR